MNSPEIRHGHGHDPLSRLGAAVEGSLAYHLRRYRKHYGDHGISQRSLALIAHVSRHFIAHLEQGSAMQVSVEALLRVALALRHPVEDLIAPERVAVLREEVERRRTMLGGDASLSSPLTSTPPPTYTLAIAYCSPLLCLAVTDGKAILEVRQYRSVSARRARAIISREAKAYGVHDIIVDARFATSKAIASLGRPYKTLAFVRAKEYLAGTGVHDAPPNAQFFAALVKAHPELGRYVRVLPATGRVAMTETWKTARLIVSTLALAASVASPTSDRPLALRKPFVDPRNDRRGGETTQRTKIR